MDGFVFSSLQFNAIGQPALCPFGCTPGGGVYLAVEGPTGQPITMSRAGGGPFSLVSYDLAVLWVDFAAARAAGRPNEFLVVETRPGQQRPNDCLLPDGIVSDQSEFWSAR